MMHLEVSIVTREGILVVESLNILQKLREKKEVSILKFPNKFEVLISRVKENISGSKKDKRRRRIIERSDDKY